MDTSTARLPLTGVVPSVCDAAAGPIPGQQLRSVMTQLCLAIRSALDDVRGPAEDSLRVASEILQEMAGTPAVPQEPVRGGLSPWQIRKVINHVEAHLDRPLSNQDLAAIVHLNAAHFGRAFRHSFCEPPHEYVIRG